jgi:pimeloyl-ACP methyl ester carboxylesterase
MRLSFKYGLSTISYLRLGVGKRLLICFHGFGDHAVIWRNLERKIGHNFTLIAIDLPFHGQTDWQQKMMQIADFEKIIHEILMIENATRFSLAGFSFGARVVAKLLLSKADFIETIFLFSPDGFGTKGLKMATSVPVFLRRFVQFLFRKPAFFVQIIEQLHKKRLVPKSVHWFFSQNIGRVERRKRLFFYWLSLNDFEVKLPIFKKKLLETSIPTYVFLGDHDDIVPLSIGTFLSTDAPTVHLHIVESDHQILAHLPPFDTSIF